MQGEQTPFGKWLDTEIKSRGWSRREFGERTQRGLDKGLAPASIDKIINGEIHRPSMRSVRLIARALGLTVDEIAARVGHLPPQPDMPPRLRNLVRRLSQLTGEEQDDVLSVFEAAIRAAERRHPKLLSDEA